MNGFLKTAFASVETLKHVVLVPIAYLALVLAIILVIRPYWYVILPLTPVFAFFGLCIFFTARFYFDKAQSEHCQSQSNPSSQLDQEDRL